MSHARHTAGTGGVFGTPELRWGTEGSSWFFTQLQEADRVNDGVALRRKAGAAQQPQQFKRVFSEASRRFAVRQHWRPEFVATRGEPLHVRTGGAPARMSPGNVARARQMRESRESMCGFAAGWTDWLEELRPQV